MFYDVTVGKTPGILEFDGRRPGLKMQVEYKETDDEITVFLPLSCLLLYGDTVCRNVCDIVHEHFGEKRVVVRVD